MLKMKAEFYKKKWLAAQKVAETQGRELCKNRALLVEAFDELVDLVRDQQALTDTIRVLSK